MSRITLPENITVKVARAEHHLHSLRTLLDEFAATQPITAEPFFSPWQDNEGGWGARLHVVSEAPAEVPLLVGDFLHNLRSSLDYLARALVETSGNQPKDGIGGTAFPILGEHKEKGTLQVKGAVDPEIGLVLESLQPYKASEGAVESHPLQLLHKFSIADKHRELQLPLIAAVEPVSMLVVHADPLPIGFIQATMRPFIPGEDLIMPVVPFPSSAKVEVIAALHPIVALDGAYHYEGVGTVDLIDQLGYMLKTVRDRVIPSFRQFFSTPWPDNYFAFNPVPGPMGFASTPARVTAVVDGLIRFLAAEYKSDRILVLGLIPGINAPVIQAQRDSSEV